MLEALRVEHVAKACETLALPRDPLVGRDVENGPDGLEDAVHVAERDPRGAQVDMSEGFVGDVALVGGAG